jgi:hypothetical protein
LLLHLPFGLLHHGTSQILYFFLTVVLTIALARFTLVACERRPTVATVFGLAAVILASRPGHQNLLLGQTTLELVFGVYVALHYSGRSVWVSGLGLAVAMQKAQFGIPVSLFMLCQKRIREVIAGIGITGIATAVAVAILSRSAGGTVALVSSLWGGLLGAGAGPTARPAASFLRVDAVSLLGRLIGKPPGVYLATIVFAVVMGLACVALRRINERTPGPSADRYCLSVASLATLVGVYHQAYDTVLLILPITALVLDCWAPSEISANGRVRIVLIVFLSVPLLNYAATNTVLQHVELTRAGWSSLTSINAVALLAAFGIYVALPFLKGRVNSRLVS